MLCCKKRYQPTNQTKPTKPNLSNCQTGSCGSCGWLTLFGTTMEAVVQNRDQVHRACRAAQLSASQMHEAGKPFITTKWVHVQPQLVATAQATCNDVAFDLMVYNVSLVQYDPDVDEQTGQTDHAEMYGIKVSDVMRLAGHADKLTKSGKSGQVAKPSFVLDSQTALNWSMAAALVGRPVPTAVGGSIQLAGTTGKSAKSSKVIQLSKQKLPVGPNDIVLACDFVTQPYQEVASHAKFRIDAHSQSFCQVFENQVRFLQDCILRDYTLAELCAQQIHVRPETAKFLVNQANRTQRAERAQLAQLTQLAQRDDSNVDCQVFANLDDCQAYAPARYSIGELANTIIQEFDTRSEGAKLSLFLESCVGIGNKKFGLDSRSVWPVDKRYRFKSRSRLDKTSQLADYYDHHGGGGGGDHDGDHDGNHDDGGGYGQQTSFDRTGKLVGMKREEQHSHKYNRSLHHSRWDKRQSTRQAAAADMIDQEKFVKPNKSTKSTKPPRPPKTAKPRPPKIAQPAQPDQPDQPDQPAQPGLPGPDQTTNTLCRTSVRAVVTNLTNLLIS